ncbi:MAG: hypothetical protein Q9179_000596 [Wetmoreana sp. 5 TL-2023]
MTPVPKTPDPHTTSKEIMDEETRVRCYVCETDLTPEETDEKTGEEGNRKKKKQGKEGKEAKDVAELKRGLVEIRSEGTGFAGGGNVGVAPL